MIHALREILNEVLGFGAISDLRRVLDIGMANPLSRPGLVVVASGLLSDNPTEKLRLLRAKVGDRSRIVILAAATDFSNDHLWLADAVLDDRLDQNEFIEGLEAALRGERVVKLLNPGRKVAAEWERLEPLLAQLRPRMREVLDLLVRGHSNNQISRALGVSEPTVKWNVSAMLAVFGLARRVDVAAAFARMRGLGVF